MIWTILIHELENKGPSLVSLRLQGSAPNAPSSFSAVLEKALVTHTCVYTVSLPAAEPPAPAPAPASPHRLPLSP